MSDSFVTHRFSEVTPNDHQAWLYVATILTLVYSVAVLAVRGLVKFGTYALDDVTCLVAYTIAIVQWSLTFYALHLGLGKDSSLVSDHDEQVAAVLVFAGRFTMHGILGLVKISCLCLLRNIFTRDIRRVWNICNVLIVLCVVHTIAACLAAGVQCHPRTALIASADATCPNNRARIIYLSVMEFVTQSLCALTPIYFFWDTQMTRARRVAVCSAFLFPLLNGVLFVSHLSVYSKFYDSVPKRDNIGVVPPLVLQQVLICFALVSTTTPCLKGFAARFMTGGLHDVVGRDTLVDVHSYSGQEGRSLPSKSRNSISPTAYEMSDMRSPSRGTASPQDVTPAYGKSHISGPLSSDARYPSSDHRGHDIGRTSSRSSTAPLFITPAPAPGGQRSPNQIRHVVPAQASSSRSSARPERGNAARRTPDARAKYDWTGLNDYDAQSAGQSGGDHDTPDRSVTSANGGIDYEGVMDTSTSRRPEYSRGAGVDRSKEQGQPAFRGYIDGRPESSNQQRMQLRPDLDAGGVGAYSTATAMPSDASDPERSDPVGGEPRRINVTKEVSLLVSGSADGRRR